MRDRLPQHACGEQADEDWGQLDDAQTIDEPPFTACLRPKVHYRMGGVKPTSAPRRRHGPAGHPGLYAAGEAVGGIHGACRLLLRHGRPPGTGRIAGQNAAMSRALAFRDGAPTPLARRIVCRPKAAVCRQERGHATTRLYHQLAPPRLPEGRQANPRPRAAE
ncbi:MAG: FAD-binding protein [Eggerthellaceae bacterium]